MNEPYILPFRLSEAELKDLNVEQNDKNNNLSPEYRFARFMKNRNSVTALDWIDEVIKACRSGKKIVNPMSPREELKKAHDYYSSDIAISAFDGGRAAGIELAVEIIAREHPDVKDWLNGGETDE